MPTNRKYRTRKRCNDDVAWQVEYLLHGCVTRQNGSKSPRPFQWQAEYDGCFASSEAARNLWNEIKNTELPRWIEARPGSRPDAWWQYDSPERVLFDDPVRTDPAKSAAYLADHGLLTSGERQALGI